MVQKVILQVIHQLLEVKEVVLEIGKATLERIVFMSRD